MRLFVALEVPASVRNDIAAFVDGLREQSAGSSAKALRWIDPRNFHITLKFIGSVPPEQLTTIRTALSRIHLESPVDLHFCGVRLFPNAQHPRMLCVNVEASADVPALVSEMNRCLVPLAIAPEARTFLPHLTLARLATPHVPQNLRGAIVEAAARDFGAFRADSFHLFESHLKSSGAEYTILQTLPFALEA